MFLPLLLTLLSSFSAQNVHGKIPNFVLNMATGSSLKCVADICGGLPMENWKSSVIFERMHGSRKHDVDILYDRLRTSGMPWLWSGLPARLTEGVFSGAVLLATKEALGSFLSRRLVSSFVSPRLIGFISGAGGGMAQAVVMTPCSLLVTAAATGNRSIATAASSVWERGGPWAFYTGYSAVAFRQATNWASRQGCTELVRPCLPMQGVSGEIIAGCIGGTLSVWNTPFEVARIYSQARIIDSSKAQKEESQYLSSSRGIFGVCLNIVDRQGIGSLYCGLLPRVFQACYQTIFMVCVPRVLQI